MTVNKWIDICLLQCTSSVSNFISKTDLECSGKAGVKIIRCLTQRSDTVAVKINLNCVDHILTDLIVVDHDFKFVFL